MAALVKIELEVTPDAAAALEDPTRRRSMGVIVSTIVRQENLAAAERLRSLFGEIRQDAQAAGLSDAEVEADLAAYNAERRS